MPGRGAGTFSLEPPGHFSRTRSRLKISLLRIPIQDLCKTEFVCLFFPILFECKSFRPVPTIAGLGGVTGPLPRLNEGGRATGNKVVKKTEFARQRWLPGIYRLGIQIRLVALAKLENNIETRALLKEGAQMRVSFKKC